MTSAHVRLNVTQARRAHDSLDRPVQLVVASPDWKERIDLTSADAVALAEDLIRAAQLAPLTPEGSG